MRTGCRPGPSPQDRIDDAVAADPAGQVRAGPVRAADAAAGRTPTWARRPIARSPGRPSPSRRVLLKTTPGVLPIAPGHRRSCSPARAPTTSASSRAAGRSTGRAAAGPITTGTTIADALGARLGDTSVRRRRRVPGRHEGRRSGSSSWPSGPMPRAWATPRRSRCRRRISRSSPGCDRSSTSLVVVVLSGRPVMLDDARRADAVVAAWLPGTEGAGVADVLLGDDAVRWPHAIHLAADTRGRTADREGAL